MSKKGDNEMEVVRMFPRPIYGYAALVKLEDEDVDNNRGIIVDIKLLKLALLNIQKDNPGVVSVRIGTAKNYGHDFLTISTESQEKAGKRETYMVSPLTEHTQTSRLFDVDDEKGDKET